MMVSWGGLEPPTRGLKGHCSTIELPTHLKNLGIPKRSVRNAKFFDVLYLLQDLLENFSTLLQFLVSANLGIPKRSVRNAKFFDVLYLLQDLLKNFSTLLQFLILAYLDVCRQISRNIKFCANNYTRKTPFFLIPSIIL
jgi:hypothetical protein